MYEYIVGICVIVVFALAVYHFAGSTSLQLPGQLTDGQRRVMMSGSGVVGTAPVWPRQNIFDGTSVTEIQRDTLVGDYNSKPQTYVNIGGASDIRGCADLCASTGKCAGGAYYFKDMTDVPEYPVGVCFGAPA
jgi:hypothetical protein